MHAVTLLGPYLAAAEGRGHAKIILQVAGHARGLLAGRRDDDDAAPRRHGRGHGLRQARTKVGLQGGHDGAGRLTRPEPRQQGMTGRVGAPALPRVRGVNDGPRGSSTGKDLFLRARVPGRHGERQHLGRRGKETRGDTACGLVQGRRQHGRLRYDRLEAPHTLAHLATGALDNPAVDAGTRHAHPNERPDLGPVNESVGNQVIERPIHVGQIDVDEHTGDLRAARGRRVETVEQALRGHHEPSETQRGLICGTAQPRSFSPYLAATIASTPKTMSPHSAQSRPWATARRSPSGAGITPSRMLMRVIPPNTSVVVSVMSKHHGHRTWMTK